MVSITWTQVPSTFYCKTSFDFLWKEDGIGKCISKFVTKELRSEHYRKWNKMMLSIYSSSTVWKNQEREKEKHKKKLILDSPQVIHKRRDLLLLFYSNMTVDGKMPVKLHIKCDNILLHREMPSWYYTCTCTYLLFLQLNKKNIARKTRWKIRSWIYLKCDISRGIRRKFVSPDKLQKWEAKDQIDDGENQSIRNKYIEVKALSLLGEEN